MGLRFLLVHHRPSALAIVGHLMRSHDGSHCLEVLFEAELRIQAFGSVVLRTDDDEGEIAPLGHLIRQVLSKADSIPFPPELGLCLHGKHGAVVRLHHPSGQLPRAREHPEARQLIHQFLKNLYTLHLVGRIQVVDDLCMLGSQLQHLRTLCERPIINNSMQNLKLQFHR